MNVSQWKERVHGRQTNYCEPRLARPYHQRLIDVGVTPTPKKLTYGWRDLHNLSEKDRADVALKMVQAVMQYVTGGCEQVLPLEYLYSLFVGLPRDTVKAIMAHLNKGDDKFTAEGDPVGTEVEKAKIKADNQPPPAPTPQGGGRAGNPGGNPGRPRGTVEGQ